MAKKVKITGKAKERVEITGKTKRKIDPVEFAKAIGAEPLDSPLTIAQIEQLAKKLLGTKDNVYTVVESMFGIKVDDQVFDLLHDIGKVFHCEECSEWLLVLHEERTQKGLGTVAPKSWEI